MLSKTPVVTEMQVIPVAGYDSMEMTLSGAHAPFFTRNLVIIKDSTQASEKSMAESTPANA